jgi:hypothetical protein
MPPVEEKPKLSPVPVWRCKNSDCKAWVREELARGPSPSCPLCNGSMMRSMKHLPELVKKYKKEKKDASETSATQ